MKIASIQFNSVWEDCKTNLDRVEGFVKRAQKDACDLIVFPEMFNSGFSMNAVKISEPLDGKTSQLLSVMAQKYAINVIAGFTEKEGNHFNNIALVLNTEGQSLAKYHKNYPYSHAGESQYYQAGTKQVVFDMDGINASVFICYDLRFPELFRKVAAQVEMIVVIASWPEPRQEHWLALLKARAIENQCFVVGVNRIGQDGNGLNYTGGSQVFDPMGRNISVGYSDQEYLVSSLEMTEVQQTRNQLPFLKDIKHHFTANE